MKRSKTKLNLKPLDSKDLREVKGGKDWNTWYQNWRRAVHGGYGGIRSGWW